MKLLFNYMYREIVTGQRNGYMFRTTVNDRQIINNDYRFELEFDVGINDQFCFDEEQEEQQEQEHIQIAQQLKAEIRDRICELFSMYSDDTNDFPYNLTAISEDGQREENVNCWAFRFDDEEYDEENYSQLGGRGWRYYNFPPIGKNDQQMKVDVRNIIDGLLRTEGIAEYITSLQIYYNDQHWRFDGPCADEGIMLMADRLFIDRYLPEDEVLDIIDYDENVDSSEELLHLNDVRFFFPNVLDEANDNFEGSITCSRYTTKCACICSGSNFRSSEELASDNVGQPESVNISSKRRVFNHDRSRYIWVLNGSLTYKYLVYGKEKTVIHYGDFCPVDILDKPEGGAVINPQFLAFCEVSFSDYDNKNVSLGEMQFSEGCYFAAEDLLNDRISAQSSGFSPRPADITNKDSALLLCRGCQALHNADIQNFGLMLLPEGSAAETGCFYYNIEDDIYRIGIEYRLDGFTIEVNYCSDEFYRETFKPVGLSLTVNDLPNVRFNYDYNTVSEQILFRSMDWSEKKGEADPAAVNDFINRFEFSLPVSEFAGNISTLVSDIPSEISALRKENTPDILDGLRYFLSLGNKKGIKLSISKSLENAMALCFSSWLPLMNEAKKAGTGMADHINGKDKLPKMPVIAIMGEAGCGKTTIAEKISKGCIGAKFKGVLGSDLLPQYIGWDRINLAKCIYELQKDTAENQPAVLFIDEAYTLFESNKNSEKASGNIVELLLKCTEDTEEDFDVSELSDRIDAFNFYTSNPEDYSDQELYRTVSENGKTKVYVNKVRKRKNTVIWIGGYEDRLRKSFSANEGLARRFARKLIIPTPKMNELWSLFDDRIKAFINTESLKPVYDSFAKKTKSFLIWASAKNRSRFFGNYAGIDILTDYFRSESMLGKNPLDALDASIEWLKMDITSQYKASLLNQLDTMPFEVVTEISETLDDYIGNDDLKHKMDGIIDMMVNREKYVSMKTELPKGALLVGPPGTGKTMLVRCMCGEISKRMNVEAFRGHQKDVVMIPINASEILSCKDGIAALKILFSEAASYDAAVIFLDEIDSIGMRREYNNHRDILTQLMKELDGFESGKNVFVIAATNDPGRLDDALVRPGRFDMRFVIGRPDIDSSSRLIASYLARYGIDHASLSAEQKNRLLSYLGGMSPAYIKANINQAVILYHQVEEGLRNDMWKYFPLEYEHRKENGEYLMSSEYDGIHVCDFSLFLKDLKETIDITSIGRRRAPYGEENFTVEKGTNGSVSSVAVHEIGHALAALVLGVKEFEKITVLGRGKALGYVELSADSVKPVTRKDFLKRIMISMGGRAAEEIIYGKDEVSAGAGSDMINATGIAKSMVTEMGFSDKIGFMSLGTDEESYLGDSRKREASGKLRDLIDEEVRNILDECMKTTLEILGERKELLIDMARILFEKKEVKTEDLTKMLSEWNNK